jgi:hypothetical protein
MIYRNEDELKKALQISSWKNLSKDKLVGSGSSEGALDVIAKRYDSALDHNKQSLEAFYQGTRELRSILASQLDKDYLTRDERESIIESSWSYQEWTRKRIARISGSWTACSARRP